MPRLLVLRPPRAVAALKLLSHQCGTRRAVRTARSWVCRRVVIERWRCLACLLLRVQCLVPAIALVFGTTGFFGLAQIPRWVLALSLCERAELIFVVISGALLPKKRAAQALLPARYSRPAPQQRKHGVTDGWKGPPTSRALPEHKNAGRRGRTFGARDDETPSLVTNFTRIRRRWNATGAGVAPGRDFAGTGKTSRLSRARSINVDLRFIVLTSFP